MTNVFLQIDAYGTPGEKLVAHTGRHAGLERHEQRRAALVVRCGMVWEEVRKHRSAAHMPSC